MSDNIFHSITQFRLFIAFNLKYNSIFLYGTVWLSEFKGLIIYN